jgi:DNA invertase Pin-like site-specific DNA recombinase
MFAHLSRTGQTLQAQMHDLFDLACQSGCEIVATLPGKSIEEPDKNGFSEFEEFLNSVARKHVGVVIGWSTDRLGRSSQHLVITPAKDIVQAYPATEHDFEGE